MQAALVEAWASGFWEKNEAMFRVPPVDTFLAHAMLALQEHSMIHVSEAIREERLEQGIGLAAPAELDLHRDAATHPKTSRWRAPGRQAFYDEARRFFDNRAAILWEIQRRINALLEDAGEPPYTIEVTREVATTLREILVATTHAASHRRLPTVAQLQKSMAEMLPLYLKALEGFPSGRVPRRN